MIEVDARRPGLRAPDQADRPALRRRGGRTPRSGRRAGRSSPTATACAASSPRPRRKRIFGIDAIRRCSSSGVLVICAGGGGIPTTYTADPCPRAGGSRRRGRDRQGSRERAARDRARRRRAADRHRRRRRLRPAGARRTSKRSAPQRRPSCPRSGVRGRLDGPEGAAACWFAERTGGFAAIGSIHDTQALLRGDAGTRVAVQTAVHTG